MWIVPLALRRPYTFVVAAILIAILGGIAISRMPTDILPDVDIPVVSAIWQYKTKVIELDRMETFTTVVLQPRIVLRTAAADRGAVEKRARRALESAQKYSLVANSVKSRIQVNPQIEINL